MHCGSTSPNNPAAYTYQFPCPQVYTAPEVLACKPYNTQVDVYSFAITLLEIGCRDHRFVVEQFSANSVGNLRVAAVTATDHVGFRPIPKEEFVEALPDLWALVSFLLNLARLLLDIYCACANPD